MNFNIYQKYYSRDFDGPEDFLGLQKCLNRICVNNGWSLESGTDDYGEFLVMAEPECDCFKEKSFIRERIEKINALEAELNEYQESQIKYKNKLYEADDCSITRLLVLQAMFRLKGITDLEIFSLDEIRGFLKVYCERFLSSDAKFSDLKNQSRKIDNVNDLNKLSIDEVIV